MRIGINGLGRIGRLAIRALQNHPSLELMHVNDVAGDAFTHAHLLAFDSVHGQWDVPVSAEGQHLVIDGKSIKVTSAKTLEEADFSGCDLILECTGKFKSVDALRPYLDAGIGQVVVSAPIKVPEVLNVVMGVNHSLFDADKYPIVTAASCTTNCLALGLSGLTRSVDIERGFYTTIHAITNDQVLIDSAHRDPRRGRSANSSMIPTSTNAIQALEWVMPELSNRIHGFSVRVPTQNVSCVDLTVEFSREMTEAEIMDAMHQWSQIQGGLFAVNEEPLVSIDFNHSSASAIVDATLTNVVGTNMGKISAWYDNEWGFSNRMCDLAEKLHNIS